MARNIRSAPILPLTTSKRVRPPEDIRPSVMPTGLTSQSFNSPMMEAFRKYDSEEDRIAFDVMCGRDPTTTRYLGRFVLPDFQRPLVWTDAQKIRFIESIWLDYDIGRYVIIGVWGSYSKWTDVLIDGQQRLSAIFDYVEDKFPVFGYKYSELPMVDRRHFDFGKTFAKSEIRTKLNEEEIRDIYNRLNYGGTAHTEDQRA